MDRAPVRAPQPCVGSGAHVVGAGRTGTQFACGTEQRRRLAVHHRAVLGRRDHAAAAELDVAAVTAAHREVRLVQDARHRDGHRGRTRRRAVEQREICHRAQRVAGVDAVRQTELRPDGLALAPDREGVLDVGVDQRKLAHDLDRAGSVERVFNPAAFFLRCGQHEPCVEPFAAPAAGKTEMIAHLRARRRTVVKS
jgi:hypothetical protein